MSLTLAKYAERNLNTRLKEHLDSEKSAISKHLTDCDNANYLININNLYDNVLDSDSHTGEAVIIPSLILYKITQKFFTLWNSRIQVCFCFLKPFKLNLKNQNLTVA